MAGKKLKIVLLILLALFIIGAGYFFYLYNQGGEENYTPPAQNASPEVQVVNDMTMLSDALEAYYTKNLNYPEKLDVLAPEFMDKLPVEPSTGQPFVYQLDDSGRYRITVADPSRYGFKELFIENGQIIKK